MRVASAIAGELVVELGEDELEDFLEDIDAGIREDFILHIFDEVAQGAGEDAFLRAGFFLLDERVDRPWLASDVFDRLVDGREVWNFDEVVWVPAMPDDGRRAIAPQREQRAGGVGSEPSHYVPPRAFRRLRLCREGKCPGHEFWYSSGGRRESLHERVNRAQAGIASRRVLGLTSGRQGCATECNFALFLR